jgi:hypothetical protein
MLSLETLTTIALTSTITSGFNAVTTFFVYKIFLSKLEKNK